MKGYSLKTILGAWLITGTMDMSTACLNYYHKTGKPIDNIFKFIASGLTGQSAFTGGAGISLIGVLLHYLVALLFVFFIFLSFAELQSLPAIAF